MKLVVKKESRKIPFCARFGNCRISLRYCLLLVACFGRWNGTMECTAISVRRSVGTRMIHHYSDRQTRLFATKLGENDDSLQQGQPQTIAIVGGGLAGLSTAFHLLQKEPSIDITILDKTTIGTGGASSVAGGLLHPLSPPGKLVFGGLEGLHATNKLVQYAQRYKPCIIRQNLYRVALDDENVQQLRQTAEDFPHFAKYIGREEMQDLSQSRYALGGLQLSNGCKVLDVPLYLQGLWMACEEISRENGDGRTRVRWQTLNDDTPTISWRKRLRDFDTVLLAAGAGLFQNERSLLSMASFPVDLIRGQSIEMNLPNGNDIEEALLCGKYISPLVTTATNDSKSYRVLIGATHEWKSEPLTTDELVNDLRERSYRLSPNVWDEGEIHKTTSGYRVQSRRGKHGRLPIVGKLHDAVELHDNTWIFTGLSSRGLLYHGLYGDILTDVLLDRNTTRWAEHNLDWWR